MVELLSWTEWLSLLALTVISILAYIPSATVKLRLECNRNNTRAKCIAWSLFLLFFHSVFLSKDERNAKKKFVCVFRAALRYTAKLLTRDAF